MPNKRWSDTLKILGTSMTPGWLKHADIEFELVKTVNGRLAPPKNDKMFKGIARYENNIYYIITKKNYGF